MNGFVIAMALLVGAPAADTTVTLREGDQVVVQNLTGEIFVEPWSRSELRVTGEDRDEVDVVVTRSGSRVVIRPNDRRGRKSVEMTLRLPPWAELEIGGMSLDVTVEGMQAGVTVENVEGDIGVFGTSGPLDLTTVEGEVDVRGARGNVRVDAQSDEVFLEDITGDVRVTAGSGDIDLIGIEGGQVFAETVSGDLTFVGRLQDGGTYEFSVHSGDADVTLPGDVSSRVSVSTFDGEFDSDFPVRVQGYSAGRTFDFTLGDGAASLSIQVFDGEIHLREGSGTRSR
jgi:DUF4097 and DUF4098 domain-containing protein YvlB